MKNHIPVTIITYFFLIGIYSCSSSAKLATQTTEYTIPTFTIPDSLLNKCCIDENFYSIRPAEFYEPTLQIRDSFTNVEKCMVGLKDETLFKRRPEIILNFENLEENSYFFPLPGARLLSAYGRRNGRPHTGIDLKINRRDTILATFDGIVRMVGWARGYGNVIVIRHYNGLETVYAHNSKHLVKSGDKINAGTPIAITGATGRASTDHLHYEIRINGNPINPNIIIDFTTQQIRNQRIVFTPGRKGKVNVETV